MNFIYSFFKRYRLAILVSVLWGCCLLLGIINQWPYFWRRSFPVQFLLSAFITAAGAGLFFLLLKGISRLYINRTNKEKLYLILSSFIVGVFFTVILFRTIPFSQYPFFSHTLIISAIDKKNPASSSSDVKLLEIKIDGKHVSSSSLTQVKNWSKEEDVLRSHGKAMLIYVFTAGLDPTVEILFESNPSAGLAQIEFDNQDPIVKDIYSAQMGNTFFSLPPFALNIKHPLFLFVMLLFVVYYIVIFCLILCLHVITYIGLQKYILAGLQRYIKELPKYVFQLPRVEDKLLYENHEIDQSLMARALVLLAPIGYLLYYIFQGKFLLLGNTDHVDAQLPYLFAAKNALSLGQLSWWNPYIFNGTPLWGNPALFLWYPPTWIELLAPRSLMLYVSTFVSWVHYGGVFLAAFLYFRALIGNEKWASFSALAYGFSISVAYGLAVGNAHLPIYVFLPLCLYILHTYGQRSLRRTVIYLTISLYCMITGGFLQFLIYAMAIISSYVLFIALQSNSRKEAFSLIGLFAMSLLIAVLLSAPAWLSILYMAGLVSRVSDANTSLQGIFNGGVITPIDRLLRLFFPNGFGFDIQYPYSYVETAVCFSGVSALYLAGSAVVHKPSRVIYYWAGIVIAMLLLCFTRLVFLQNLVFGGVEIMSERLLFLLPLGMASLAGLGGKNLCELPIPRWRLLIFNPFNILLAIVVFSNFKLISLYIVNISLTLQYFIESKTWVLSGSSLPEFELVRAVVIILALGIVLCNKKIIRVFWIASMSLLLFEAIPSTYLMHKIQLNPLMISPSKPFFAFDNIETLLPFSASELEIFRLVITEKIPSRRANDAPPYAKESNQGSIYQYQSPWGYANGYSSNLASLIQTVGAVDFDTTCETGGLINGVEDIVHNAARQVIFDPLCHPRLSDLMSVGAVIKADKEWEIAADRRDSALTRVSLFYDYEVIPDSEDASNRLTQDGFDIHKTLIVEKEPPFDVGPADPEARSVLVKNTSNEVIIQIHSNAPVLLLLTDTYSPGWIAEMDHQPVEIIRSNVAFRSVWVPKGDHTIVFHYEPPLLTFSLALGLLGIIGFLAIAASSKRRF